jgi:hypothetical protein
VHSTSAVKESTVFSSDARVLTVRLDVLRDIIIEMAAALPPPCAGRLVNAIGGRLTQRLAGIDIDEPADEALASDLAPILAALQQSRGAAVHAIDPVST